MEAAEQINELLDAITERARERIAAVTAVIDQRGK